MISYFLHSAVLLDGKILIDPHDGTSIGLPRFNVKPDIILVTHNHYDHNACELYNAKCYLSVRELNHSGYNIKGIESYHDRRKGKDRGSNTIYEIVTPDGRKIVHLGDIGHLLSDEIVKELRGADVVAVPVGGVITINADEALKIVEALSPKIVLPIHYWVKGHYMPIDPPDEFLKKIGMKVERIHESIDEKSYDSVVFIV